MLLTQEFRVYITFTFTTITQRQVIETDCGTDVGVVVLLHVSFQKFEYVNVCVVAKPKLCQITNNIMI